MGPQALPAHLLSSAVDWFDQGAIHSLQERTINVKDSSDLVLSHLVHNYIVCENLEIRRIWNMPREFCHWPVPRPEPLGAMR